MAIREPKSEEGTEANGQAPRQEPSDWTSIFNAPDYTALVKPIQSRQAKEYSDKTKSVLKALMVSSINVGDFPDAAAILTYGPAFADATGQFADQNDWCKRAVDMITAPESAPIMFVLTAIPLFSQVLRNHEAALKQMPDSRRQARLRRKAEKDGQRTQEPRFTVRMFGRAWPVYFKTPRIGKVFMAFKAQTRDPVMLTNAVFTDSKVVNALRKQGIVLVSQEDANTQPKM